MKKNLWVLCLTLLSSLMFSITALAGDINSGEQRILNTISGEYEYEGGKYKVTDEYIAKVTEYLSRDDINLTDAEADSYIKQFEFNINVGVSNGYMVRIDGGSSSDENGNNNSGDNNNSDNSGNNNGSNNSNNNGNNNKNNNKDNNSGSNTDANKSGTNNPLSGYFDQPESADGVVEDNTIGSTTDGDVVYTVLPIDQQVMYVWGVDALEVHAEAYKDSDILGTLSRGDEVTVIGAATTGWAQIDYNGTKAFVSAVYLRTQGYMISIGEIEVESVEDDESETPAEDSDAVTEDSEDSETLTEDSGDESALDAADEDESGLDEADDTENVKDYSDAAPVAKSLNLGVLALVIVIVFAIVVGVVIFLHKNKNNVFRKR